MTTVAHQFIDLLKEDNILEAIGVIKQSLTNQAVKETEAIKESIAKSFKLVPIVEKEEDDEKDEKEESDDEESDNEDEDEDDE